MNFRRTVLFALPLLLSSSVALAQEAPSSPTGVTKKDDKKVDTKKKDKKDQKAILEQKGEGGSESTTILGKKVENKDSDLDVSVSETQTTSAEQTPPRRDVIESRAEEVREGEGKRWSVAPLLGYGTADLKFGMGARAGYTFETPVYVGGTFLYHFGNSNLVTGTGVTESDRRFYYPAVEAGYDIGVGPVLVRPYGGMGVLFARTSVTANGISETSTDKQLMIYPGATAQFIFPNSPLFVGGDMRLLLPLEGESAAFSLFATAGLTM